MLASHRYRGEIFKYQRQKYSPKRGAELMNKFQKSTANIAAWNLEGYHGIPDEEI
jgi:hypothetical protein